MSRISQHTYCTSKTEPVTLQGLRNVKNLISSNLETSHNSNLFQQLVRNSPHSPISSGGPRMYPELAELWPRIKATPFSLNHYCCPPTPLLSWTFRRACYYIVFFLSYGKQMVIVPGLISIVCTTIYIQDVPVGCD